MKRIFYIVILMFGFTSGVFAQQGKPMVLNDQQVKFIHFYPNPAVTTINFEFQKSLDNSKVSTFQIYNFIGKKVYDTRAITPKINIPLTDYSRGVYIYQLRDNTGQIIESGKFQVIK